MSNTLTKYVAMLRGVGPGNPNMHQQKLVGVVENLGFSNVHGVISSGNVVFEGEPQATKVIEDMLEKTWPEKLGFNSITIVRTQEQLQQLITRDPFKGTLDEPASRLNVTFLKTRPKNKVDFPVHSLRFDIVGEYDGAVCSILNLSGNKTPALFSWVDKHYGTGNTSRTWKTVQRILRKMEL